MRCNTQSIRIWRRCCTSYGSCEAETPLSDALLFQSWARQGNAQGITWFAASGDSGGADCDDSTHTGLAVDVPAAIPEVTGVGGTKFNEGAGQFWNTTNDSNQASVLSYIPRQVGTTASRMERPRRVEAEPVLFSQSPPGKPAREFPTTTRVMCRMWRSTRPPITTDIWSIPAANSRFTAALLSPLPRSPAWPRCSIRSWFQAGLHHRRIGEHQSQAVFARSERIQCISRRHHRRQHCHGELLVARANLHRRSGRL